VQEVGLIGLDRAFKALDFQGFGHFQEAMPPTERRRQIDAMRPATLRNEMPSTKGLGVRSPQLALVQSGEQGAGQRVECDAALRIPGKATTRSSAWRPPVPGHGDQCGAGVLEGTVEWVS
jgi:hypothetical protein